MAGGGGAAVGSSAAPLAAMGAPDVISAAVEVATFSETCLTLTAVVARGELAHLLLCGG